MKSIIASLLFIIFSLPVFAQQDFRIVITNYYFGRNQYVTTVTPDSLITNQNDYNSKSKMTARKLTAKEKNELNTFLKDFPLNSLKDKYENEHVLDGTQIGFFIRIAKAQKNIFTSNVYQNDLGKLTDEIVKLLPYDYINYNKKSIPW